MRSRQARSKLSQEQPKRPSVRESSKVAALDPSSQPTNPGILLPESNITLSYEQIVNFFLKFLAQINCGYLISPEIKQPEKGERKKARAWEGRSKSWFPKRYQSSTGTRPAATLQSAESSRHHPTSSKLLHFEERSDQGSGQSRRALLLPQELLQQCKCDDARAVPANHTGNGRAKWQSPGVRRS